MLRFRLHTWGIFQATSKPISEKFWLCRRNLAGFVGIDCGEVEGEDEDDVWGGWAGMFCRGYCLKFIAFVMLLLCVRIFYTKKKDAVLLYVDGSCLSFLSRKDQIISNGLEILVALFFSSKHRIPNQPNSPTAPNPQFFHWNTASFWLGPAFRLIA